MARVEVAEILAAARTWLGTPWRHQGRLRGVCRRLRRPVGRELGLLDFDTCAYGRIPDGLQLRALCEQHLLAKQVGGVAPGNVLLMRFTRHFGAFGATWDDAMVTRWSANPLGMLWPAMDAAFMMTGGGGRRLRCGGQWSSSLEASRPAQTGRGNARHIARPALQAELRRRLGIVSAFCLRQIRRSASRIMD